MGKILGIDFGSSYTCMLLANEDGTDVRTVGNGDILEPMYASLGIPTKISNDLLRIGQQASNELAIIKKIFNESLSSSTANVRELAALKVKSFLRGILNNGNIDVSTIKKVVCGCPANTLFTGNETNLASSGAGTDMITYASALKLVLSDIFPHLNKMEDIIVEAEPILALYGLKECTSQIIPGTKYLVVDLGGGTNDFVGVEYEDTGINLITGAAGGKNPGGNDFDALIKHELEHNPNWSNPVDSRTILEIKNVLGRTDSNGQEATYLNVSYNNHGSQIKLRDTLTSRNSTQTFPNVWDQINAYLSDKPILNNCPIVFIGAGSNLQALRDSIAENIQGTHNIIFPILNGINVNDADPLTLSNLVAYGAMRHAVRRETLIKKEDYNLRNFESYDRYEIVLYNNNDRPLQRNGVVGERYFQLNTDPEKKEFGYQGGNQSSQFRITATEHRSRIGFFQSIPNGTYTVKIELYNGEDRHGNPQYIPIGFYELSDNVLRFAFISKRSGTKYGPFEIGIGDRDTITVVFCYTQKNNMLCWIFPEDNYSEVTHPICDKLDAIRTQLSVVPDTTYRGSSVCIDNRKLLGKNRVQRCAIVNAEGRDQDTSYEAKYLRGNI